MLVILPMYLSNKIGDYSENKNIMRNTKSDESDESDSVKNNFLKMINIITLYIT